jgi:hypothetical protein
VEIAEVRVGRDDGKQIQIVSGLTPGQSVVDAHLKRFSQGQRVAVLSP